MSRREIIPNSTPVDNVIDREGSDDTITVTTTPIEIKISSTRMKGRKLVTLYNKSKYTTVYWGWTDSVTSATGTPIGPNTLAEWDAGPNEPVYVVLASGSLVCPITEAS